MVSHRYRLTFVCQSRNIFISGYTMYILRTSTQLVFCAHDECLLKMGAVTQQPANVGNWFIRKMRDATRQRWKGSGQNTSPDGSHVDGGTPRDRRYFSQNFYF